MSANFVSGLAVVMFEATVLTIIALIAYYAFQCARDVYRAATSMRKRERREQAPTAFTVDKQTLREQGRGVIESVGDPLAASMLAGAAFHQVFDSPHSMKVDGDSFDIAPASDATGDGGGDCGGGGFAADAFDGGGW